MKKSTTMAYLERMNTHNDMNLILHKICFHGAATIDKVKPASLICFKNSKSAPLKDLWYHYKDEIKAILPFSFKEVKSCDQGVNVLFYRKDWVGRILRSKKNRTYLNPLGYAGISTVDEALAILSEHFKEGCPHELGIFLGYPLSDVIAFGSNEKADYIDVGYWKVYSNITRAQKIFALYDTARASIISCLEGGIQPNKVFELYPS